MKMLHTRFAQEENGQALLESAVFICLMFLFVAFALNFNYYILFINTVHSSTARASAYSANGNLTVSGALPGAAAVVAAANNETSNSTQGLTGAQASTVSVCSPASFTSGNCAGFSDPEATTANTGHFVANAVELKQTFTPIFGVGKSVLGLNLIPFSAPATVTHQVVMRALNN